MYQINDEELTTALREMSRRVHAVYGDRLRSVILYGSVARGTQTENSDIDIMLLIDGTEQELREYDDQLCEVSTDLSLKYLRVFSIIDVKYREYMEWKTTAPFYRNVDREGIVLYAA